MSAHTWVMPCGRGCTEQSSLWKGKLQRVRCRSERKTNAVHRHSNFNFRLPCVFFLSYLQNRRFTAGLLAPNWCITPIPTVFSLLVAAAPKFQTSRRTAYSKSETVYTRSTVRFERQDINWPNSFMEKNGAYCSAYSRRLPRGCPLILGMDIAPIIKSIYAGQPGLW